jgi:hypothetical protein
MAILFTSSELLWVWIVIGLLSELRLAANARGRQAEFGAMPRTGGHNGGSCHDHPGRGRARVKGVHRSAGASDPLPCAPPARSGFPVLAEPEQSEAHQMLRGDHTEYGNVELQMPWRELHSPPQGERLVP